MRKFHIFIHSLLLVTSPSLLAYPQCEPPVIQQIQDYDEFNHFTYDDILQLLQDIEEEKIEAPSEETIARISHFVAFLAEQGTLPGDYEANAELNNDIAALFGSGNDFSDYAYVPPNSSAAQTILTTLYGEEDTSSLLCKHKSKKKKAREQKKREKRQRQQQNAQKEQPKHHHHHHHKNFFTKIKDFVKKHKKAIIIGAIIVVATAVVVIAVTASAGTAAAAAGAAGALDSHPKSKKGGQEDSSTEASPEIAPALTSAIDDHISSFKETVAQNQFFQPTTPQQGLSWEENGRTLGSLFAHDSYSHLPYHQIYIPPIPGWNQDLALGHSEIDRTFSTDYSYLYSNPTQDIDFNTLSHQVRGERALTFGYYDQAVQDFGKAIETNPTNPIPYLERGIAHFSLGQYDRSLEDYKEFASQTQAQKPTPLSVSEFSIGFAKGLPQGVYESGEGFVLFMTDFVQHPIQTSGQIVDSVTALVDLVRKDEWGVVAEALSPEVHQLVTQWDTLPSDKKGELAGYAVGKHGADILVPGALLKVAGKCVKSAQELAAVCKNFQTAQEILVLETAAEIGNGAKIAAVVETGQKTAFLAEELGFTGQEIGQLKRVGQLETTVTNELEYLSLPMQESLALHKKAREALTPYLKKPMPEFEVRELIHATGLPTFPRPHGIPENYIVTVSDRGAGMKYIHPQNEHVYVRVMPGKPHSPFPYQQKPYIVHNISGKALDKNGMRVPLDSPEAHIPIEEFVYRGTK